MQHRPIETGLQRGRDVPVLIGNRVFGTARLDQMSSEMVARPEVVLPLITRAVQSHERNSNRTALQQEDFTFEERPLPLGIPIRGESHDLVFIRIEVKPDVKGNQRIEDADGVRDGDLVEFSELAIPRVIDGGTYDLTHAIDYHDQTL